MPLERFTTERLSVRGWNDVIAAEAERAALEADLAAILTSHVLAHLPPTMQLDQGSGGIASWVDARAAESEVLLVERRGSGALIGLLILAPQPGAARPRTYHIGYLLGETAWGRGLASELVSGLVAAMRAGRPVRLIGGVDRDNPASARVLRKAGFALAPGLSTACTDLFVCDIA